MERLLQDLRYGLRTLRKNPGFTVVAALTLALGIGMNTAIFSVVNAALLRPLPYQQPERLVHLWETQQQGDFRQREASYPEFQDWVARSHAFEGLAGYAGRAFAVATPDGPQLIRGAHVSAGFFDLLGIQPAVGRAFRAGEDRPGAERIVLLTHDFARDRFGGDAPALGQTLTLNGMPYGVVGVLPATFHFAPLGGAQLWTPLDPSPSQASRRAMHWLKVIGRLKAGTLIAQAQADMEVLARALAAEHPDTNATSGVRILPLRSQLLGSIQPVLLLLLGAVGLVLLIACANVANLLLARSAVRQKEIAVRLAVGASRGQLVQQLITESVLLAVLGGVLGVVGAQWSVELLLAAIPESQRLAMPYLGDVRLDGSVLAFTFGLSLATGVLFGLGSALQASRPDLQRALKGEVRASPSGRLDLRDVLVIAEVAVAIVLLVGAGLMLRTLAQVLDEDPGFRPEGLLTLQLSLPPARYAQDSKAVALHDQMLERVAALPGVTGVATDSKLPLSGGGNTMHLRVEGRPLPAPGTEQEANIRAVSPDYFHVMGISLVRGRPFGPRDRAGAPAVTIVNRTLAERLFPGQDPLGQRLVLGFTPGQPPLEIVGIAGDVKLTSLDTGATPALYTPFAQDTYLMTTLVVRSAADPRTLAASVQRELRALEPELLISSVKTMEQLSAESPALFMRRYPALLLGLFAAVALALAVVGVYGVISYSVSQRTQEIGIRMAIGAQRRDIVRMVLRQGMGTAGVGVALGLLGSAMLARLLQGFLFGVGPMDAVTFTAVPLLLAAVALLACYLPARRATRIDPTTALR